jgi:hypothetical protein
MHCIAQQWVAYHLAIKLPDNAEPVALQKYDLLGKFADYIFPVLSAPNAPFPGDLSLWLPTLANFNRTRNIDQIDLVAHSIVEGKSNVPVVSGEAKFRTRNIGSSLILSSLKRVPKDSTFHVALVTQLSKKNLSPPDGSFESFCKNTGLLDTLIVGLHVDANGMGKMFDLPGLRCRRGTKNRPSAFARIVIFVECPGSDHLPYQDVQ